jgi:hypothetical protein
MAMPVGYYWKEGRYWKDDGSGPYSFDGATMTILSLSAEVDIPVATPIHFKDGGVFDTTTSAGTTAHTG